MTEYRCHTCKRQTGYMKVESNYRVVYCICGVTRILAPTLAFDPNRFRMLYGDWNVDEVQMVMRTFRSYNGDDIRLFKGLKIWTAWRTKWPIEKILINRKLHSLLGDFVVGIYGKERYDDGV